MILRAMDRTPFVATSLGTSYDAMSRLPVVFLLEDIRSLYNVGAILRTGDAVRLDALFLVGITAGPDHHRIGKTALGAEKTVPCQHWSSAGQAIVHLREREFEIAALDTLAPAVDLFDWSPRFPVCVIFGNEVDGMSPETVDLVDTRVRIPMLGLKHSLNVATAAGVVAFELLRKFRALHQQSSRTGLELPGARRGDIGSAE